jgi:hypothetical protein
MATVQYLAENIDYEKTSKEVSDPETLLTPAMELIGTNIRVLWERISGIPEPPVLSTMMHDDAYA